MHVQVPLKSQLERENGNDCNVGENLLNLIGCQIQAASTASATACLEGKGQVDAFQDAFASAVTKVYAAVIVNALGEVDEDEKNTKSISKARTQLKENVKVGGQSRNKAKGKGRNRCLECRASL